MSKALPAESVLEQVANRMNPNPKAFLDLGLWQHGCNTSSGNGLQEGGCS